MEIRIRSTGQLMTSEEFNRTICTLPITTAVLNQHDADAVLEGPQPTAGRYQLVARDGVVTINGEWFTAYKLVDLDAEGIANLDAQQAATVRQTRDKDLADLDWTQGKDIPDSVSNPAAVTRQALRDLPLQAGFPWEVVWPDAE
jgi:hypothetical protein